MHFARSSVGLLVCMSVAGCHAATASGTVAQDAAAGAMSARADSVIRDSVRHVLDRALRDSAFPGAIAVVGTHNRVIAQYAVGHLDWAPSPAPNEHTMWDLASLTKVV